ncbi:MAG TPA: threonine synthase [Pseudobdellovibrionaceae bacterium]
MKWVSTRGDSTLFSTSEALKQGLAQDGGLLVPQVDPEIKFDPSWGELPFSQFAEKVLRPFFVGDILEESLPAICQEAFNFPIPLEALSEDTSLLELFHGPTSAFKDVGARFLALCLAKIPDARDKVVLVATSGDTGGAVAAAFCECSDIPIAVLYPKGKISQRQEKQLTVWGKQVQAFAVRGSFDDCQRIVKEAFLSKAWQKRFQMISANSINIGRLLPQMVYFAFASLKCQLKSQLKNHSKPTIIVPSGNLGNGVGALWALRLGFPIQQVIFAHNANQAVPQYFAEGAWSPQSTIATLANAMDVGNPSNFERLRYFYPNLNALRKVASAHSVSDAQIRQTIQEQASKGWILCPHTATAVYVRELYKERSCIVVATAHPAKFETIIEPLIGKTISIPQNLNLLLSKPSVFKEISPDLASLHIII